MRCYLTNPPEHTMDIRTSDLILIREALDTQIRLLEDRVFNSREDELRILRFKDLRDNIEALILQD